MDKCFEIVDGANPNSSVIWHTQSSPSRSARSARTRFASASALVMFRTSRIHYFYVSPTDEIYTPFFLCQMRPAAAHEHSKNPNGVASLSPGLPALRSAFDEGGRGYPGKTRQKPLNPERVAPSLSPGKPAPIDQVTSTIQIRNRPRCNIWLSASGDWRPVLRSAFDEGGLAIPWCRARLRPSAFGRRSRTAPRHRNGLRCS